MCLAIFVPFSSFFLGTGRTQGLIWADDPYLPHCLRLLKHWISGQMFVPLATGTSASEKNAPRNPWIIVFFFPRIITFPIGMPFFWVYHGISQFPTLIWANEVLYHVEPFFEGREQQIEIVLEQDNHLLLAHGGCFDPIDQIGSQGMDHVFTMVFTTTWRENEVGGWHRGHHQGERYHCVLAL